MRGAHRPRPTPRAARPAGPPPRRARRRRGPLGSALRVVAVLAAALPAAALAGVTAAPTALAAPSCNGSTTAVLGTPTVAPVAASGTPTAAQGVTPAEEVAVTVTVTVCGDAGSGVQLAEDLSPAPSPPPWVWVTDSGSATTPPPPTVTTSSGVGSPTFTATVASGTELLVDFSSDLTTSSPPGTVTVTADAVVTDDAATGGQLSVAAALSGGNLAKALQQQSGAIDVVAPTIGLAAEAESVAEVGTTVNETLTATVGSGAGAGPAFDVVVAVPGDSNFTVTTTPTSTQSSSCGTTPPTIATSPSVTATWAGPLDPGCVLTVAYSGTFSATAGTTPILQDLAPTVTYQNLTTAAVTTGDSTSTAVPPPTTQTGSYKVAINSVALSYTFGATTSAQVGEMIPATVTAVFPAGGASGVTLDLAAPAGMAFVAAASTPASLEDPTNASWPPGTSSATQAALDTASVTLTAGDLTGAQFTFGAVPAGTLTFQVDEVVLCTSANDCPSTGATPTIAPGQATMVACDPTDSSACPTETADTGSLTVDAPSVTTSVAVTDTANPAAAADVVEPGDTIDLTITSVATTAGDAEALTWTVPVPPGFEATTAGCQQTSTTLTGFACPATTSTSPVVATATTLPAGDTATIVVALQALQATALPTRPTTGPTSESISTTYHSAVAVSPTQPAGVNPDAVPETFAAPVTSFSAGASAPAMGSSAAGGSAAVGRAFTVSETVDLPEVVGSHPLTGTAYALTVTTTLPAGTALAGPSTTAGCPGTPASSYTSTLFGGTVALSGASLTAGPGPGPGTSSLGFCTAIDQSATSGVGTDISSGGQTFSIDFGRVDTTDPDASITLTYSVVVLDVAGNTAGTALGSIGAATTYTDTEGVSQTATATFAPHITVVEPAVTVSAAATITNPETGTTNPVVVSYTVTATAGSGADASTADSVVFGAASLDSALGGVTCTSGCSLDGAGLPVMSASSLAPGASASFTFTAAVAKGTAPGQLLVNWFAAQWASVTSPAATAVTVAADTARSGTYAETTSPCAGATAPDDYCDAASNELDTTAGALSVTSTPGSTSGPTDVDIGQTITYDATVTLPRAAGSTVTGLAISAQLGNQLCELAHTATITSTGSAVTPSSTTPSATETNSCSPAGPAPATGGTSTFSFGAVTVGACTNPCAAAELQLTIAFQAIVLPSAANGQSLAPQVELDIEGCAPTATPGLPCATTRTQITAPAPALDVEEPVVAMSAAWGATQGQIGAATPVSVTVTNSGKVPAYNVEIRASANANVSALVASGGACVVAGGGTTLTLQPSPSGGTLGELDAGQSAICELSATIAQPASATDTDATLTATALHATTQPTSGPYVKDEAAANAIAPATATLPIAVQHAALAVTVSAPGAPFAAGGTAAFQVTVTNSGPDTISTGSLTVSSTLSQALAGLQLIPAAGQPGVVTSASTTATSTGPATALATPTGSWTWSGFSMAPGQSVSGSLTGTLPASANGSLTVTVTAAPPPSFLSPVASASVTAHVQAAFGLAAGIQRQGAVLTSQDATYVLTVTNTGPSNAGTISLVTTTSPATFVVVKAAGPGWACADVHDCSMASLASGASARLTFTILPNVPTGTAVTAAVKLTALGSPGAQASDSTTVSASSVVIAGTNGSYNAASGSAGGGGSANPLAYTGAPVTRELGAAVAMVLAGLAGVALSRRRRATGAG